MAKKFRIPGVSFSWKRALGLSQAKQKLSRKIGVPLSRGGLERKVGRMLLGKIFGKGCGSAIFLMTFLFGAVAIFIAKIIAAA